jgi:hypothetical protein
VNSNNFAIQPGKITSEVYKFGENTLRINEDGILVLSGAPHSPNVNVGGKLSDDLKDFLVYEVGISVRVNSAKTLYEID